MDITSYIWNYMELYNQILKKRIYFHYWVITSFTRVKAISSYSHLEVVNSLNSALRGGTWWTLAALRQDSHDLPSTSWVWPVFGRQETFWAPQRLPCKMEDFTMKKCESTDIYLYIYIFIDLLIYSFSKTYYTDIEGSTNINHQRWLAWKLGNRIGN